MKEDCYTKNRLKILNKSFLILLFFVSSNSFSRKRMQPVLKSYEEYSFSACKKYSKSNKEILYCKNGLLAFSHENSSISEVDIIASSLLNKQGASNFLGNLKEYIGNKIQKRVLYFIRNKDCFTSNFSKPNSLSKRCKRYISSVQKLTETLYSSMRQRMALMNGIDMNGEFSSEIHHPNEKDSNLPIPTPPLEVGERNALLSLVGEQLEVRENELIANSEIKCSEDDNPCKRALDKEVRAALASFRRELSEQARNEYETIISIAPYFKFMEVAENKETENGKNILNINIQNAIDNMGDFNLDGYLKYEKIDSSNFTNFFQFSSLINEYLQSLESSLSVAHCAVAEKLHRKYGPSGTKDTSEVFALAAVSTLGGGLCALTAGVACVIAVGVGTEGLGFVDINGEIDEAAYLYELGFETNSDIERFKDERELNGKLLPLALLGFKGSKTISPAISSGSNKIVKGSLDAFKNEFLKFSPTSASQNIKWIQKARSAKNGFFFDVENAALKSLNDRLGDKNLVTTLTNFHKEILFEKLDELVSRSPGLKVLKYSDFKSSRFSFEGDIPDDLTDQLKKLFDNTNKTFSKRVEEEFDLSINEEVPSIWFNAGMGNSADAAGIAARNARTRTLGEANVVEFSQVKESLKSQLTNTERLRIDVINILKANPELIEKSSNFPIPTVDLFEVLRKSKNKSDIELVQILKSRFGLEINEADSATLKKYLNEVDSFSPGIWIEDRVVANLDDAVEGGFSVDFKGMGAQNIHRVAQDIAGNTNTVDDVIDTIRVGEGEITEQFNLSKSNFVDLVDDVFSPFGLDIKTLCSGDDCISYGNSNLPLLAKEKLLEAITNNPNPAQYRISFIPAAVEASSRSTLAVHGELVEKNLRGALTGVGMGKIDPAKLDNIAIAVEMPSALSSGALNIHIKGREVLFTESEKRLIKDSISGAIDDANKALELETGVSTNYSFAEVLFH